MEAASFIGKKLHQLTLWFHKATCQHFNLLRSTLCYFTLVLMLDKGVAERCQTSEIAPVNKSATTNYIHT